MIFIGRKIDDMTVKTCYRSHVSIHGLEIQIISLDAILEKYYFDIFCDKS
jgi:hypothetical protein